MGDGLSITGTMIALLTAEDITELAQKGGIPETDVIPLLRGEETWNNGGSLRWVEFWNGLGGPCQA